MQVLPVQTRRLSPGDNIADVVSNATEILDNDIVCISSKALSVAEKRMINLHDISVTSDAQVLHSETRRSVPFCQAVLEETARLHGHVVHTCPGAALTEVRPEGLATGTILIANAGLDESNAPEGYAIGWPLDPVKSMSELRKEFEKHNRTVAVILTDSCCTPRRSGVTAFALVVSGLDPLQSMKGVKDLYGKPLTITTEAIADQLATAANFVMGNAGQSIPAAIIRDHGLTLSDWKGWVPGIEPSQDLFRRVT